MKLTCIEYISYIVLKCLRAIRWLLPVMVACMLYYGPVNEEFLSPTVSFHDVYDNAQIVSVPPNKEKEFTFIDYNTFVISTVTITPNTTNISSKSLDQLLLRWLVDSDAMNVSVTGNGLIKDKIDLLLLISSPDFWAQNFFIHSKQSRVSWWLWGHARYLFFVRELQTIANRGSLLSAFTKISNKLVRHSYYEEIMLYPFIEDNFKIMQLSGTAQELKAALESMTIQHIPIHKQEDDIFEAFENEGNSVSDLQALILKWQRSLEAHFLEEEQTIVHILLKFDNPSYRRYLYYLTPGYLLHALDSFVDYSLNLVYIT